MWAVVVNPTSGRGNGARVASKVIGFLANKKITSETISGVSSTATLEHLKHFVAKNPKVEGIIAVGGDGLAQLALQVAAAEKIPLSVIAAGTGNDFARSIGWDLSDFETQLSTVLASKPESIDLGLVDGEWFGAILSTGFDSVVNERANTMKWPKGPMKYTAAIAMELPKFEPRNYSITLDGKVLETKAMLIAIGNGNSYGGGMLVCPDADLNDGHFDVMILEPVSRVEFLKVFPKVFSGRHVTHPQVSIHRAKKVSISANAVAYADGERIGALPISAETIPHALLTWRP